VDFNLNKLQVTLDLTHPKAVELAKRLIAISDVVIESNRPGAFERLGLSYEEVRKVKPDIIMLSHSGFGQTGPDREYLGAAPVFAATSGLSHFTGYPDGIPSELRGSPDMRSGQYCAFAVLAALFHRRRTGQGQYIDVSGRETSGTTIGDILLDYTMNRRIQERRGNRDYTMAPHNCYRCREENSFVSIAVATEEEWGALCRAMGEPELAADTRFADSLSRWENQEELDPIVESWTLQHTDYEVMEVLQKAGVAAVPSMSSSELFSDPHLRERGFIHSLDYSDYQWLPDTPKPASDDILHFGMPWRLHSCPDAVNSRAPYYGEHNQHVFGKLLGMGQEEIAALEREGAIA
jgi:benzylsuccinate CoA-transferase BbsF subunit